MAKKAERKAREEAERRTSGVPLKGTTAAPSGVTAAGPSPKDVKRQLRAARPAKPADGEQG